MEEAFSNVKRIQLKSYHSAKPENRDKIELDPIKIFHKAVENATPVMELLKMKRGGVSYQVSSAYGSGPSALEGLAN